MNLDVATVLNGTSAKLFAIREGQLIPSQATPAILQRTFSGLTTDSRLLAPRSLFVALAGERVDGHDFAAQSIQSGAEGCLISSVPDSLLSPVLTCPSADVSPLVFLVPDPLVALQKLASYWRKHHECAVVGVTGSIGKTTTKEMIAALLSTKLPVLKSEANFNTEIGLPLTLLSLNASHRAAVLEMGMYGPGEIALLARIAAPQTGIVTNVAPIHLERLGSIERIARAKSELVAALPPSGLAILNADDPWTRAMAQTSGVSPMHLVGFSGDADYRATDVVSHGLQGLSFTVEAEGAKTPVHTKVPGEHLLHALLFAIAVGRSMEMSWPDIQQALAEVQFDLRQRIIEAHGMLIIDDTYNAAPPSMEAALNLLATSPGTRVAVLGDMLELGEDEERAHYQVGEKAADVADWLVLRGPRARWIREGAEQSGLDKNKILSAGTNVEAAQQVRALVSSFDEGSTHPSPSKMQEAAEPTPTSFATHTTGAESPPWSVLVKGSRGMRMEEIVDGLRGMS